MKMAEKSVLLTFQNNCESSVVNDRIGEVVNKSDGAAEDKIANDIIKVTTNIEKPEDEPSDVLLNSINIATREDAVENFLPGTNKNEFNDDDAELMMQISAEAENEGIDFKCENSILECTNDAAKIDFSNSPDIMEEDIETVEEHIIEEASEENSEEKEDNANCLDVDEKMPDIDEEIKEEESPVDTSIGDVIEENGFEEKNVKVKDDEPGKDDAPQSPDIEEVKPDEPENNEESNSNTSEESQSNKRKYDDPEAPNKRLCREIQENFYARDKIFSEVTEMSNCTTVDQLHNQTEQILAEIRTLNELAKEKEREWNNIIHLKKLKEELLLRIQRRKQVMLLNSGETENDQQSGERVKNGSSILKSNLTNPKKFPQMKNSKQQGLLQRTPPQYHLEANGSLDSRGQTKQRPVLDVQSIIADYRQRHPETVPRRGRRIRNTQTLGSGSQVHQNIQGLDVGNDLGMLLNVAEASQNDNSRPSSAESTSGQGNNEPSFKDMLVQFAKLSKSERNELIQNAIKPPPPYPEVTVHPVPTTNSAPATNSLLHGILTKAPTKSNSKTSFSPTLARLLTTPEKGNGVSAPTGPNSLITAGNVSISEILSTSKSRSEITITPVDAQYEAPIKRKATKQVLDEEEAEDSADRLVIDESNENHDARGKGDNSSDTGDEVPQCQGCNQKSALFVCAGCGNQWYCSRDCQVSAWDEHSEVCSG